MSTCNFKRMNYNMPMICGYLDFEECKTSYEEETGEEYSELMFYDEQEEQIREAQEMAESFSAGLKYHNITIKSGYYDGFQFWVEEKTADLFDLDRNSDYCIDNDDAYYYYDLCRSKVLREADAEKRKISKWLLSLDGNGYEAIVCLGVFSNGEAVYRRLRDF